MNIIFVGLSGVPYQKRAIDIRLLAFAELFVKIGHRVLILNRNAIEYQKSDMSIAEGIEVLYVISKQPKNKIEYIFNFILAIILEPFRLLRIHRAKRIDVIHVASGHYVDILIYKAISKITGAKLVYHYCEYRSAFITKSPYHIINGKLVNKCAPKLWDGAICISNFLVEKTKEVNKEVKTVKVPPICDFDFFDKIEAEQDNSQYILFCGSVNFHETIDLIISSYYKSRIHNTIKLKLVLNGNQNLIDEIKEKYPEVLILQRLEYSKLISLYKGAIALLIPLRSTIQDTARFPNKICEYLGSAGVLVTTNHGEMPYYFKDKINALVADDFELNSYSRSLDWLSDNSMNLDMLRINSYRTGREYFHQYSYSKAMSEFLSDLKSK